MTQKRHLSYLLFLLNPITLWGTYPEYQKINSLKKEMIENRATSGSYLSQIYTDNIRTDVNSILEIGSRDAIDALKLSEHYKCHVFAFECNPDILDVCKKNIGSNQNVTLVPCAVWNKTGPVSFFPMVETPSVFYNPGASSCFKVDREGHHKTYIQAETTVPAIRLDEWLKSKEIDSIDMLCIDAQGAALQVLEGMGKYLDTVNYIITEIEHKTIYAGETLYPDVAAFLDMHGFQMYVGSINRFFGDYLFIRKDLIQAWDALN